MPESGLPRPPVSNRVAAREHRGDTNKLGRAAPRRVERRLPSRGRPPAPRSKASWQTCPRSHLDRNLSFPSARSELKHTPRQIARLNRAERGRLRPTSMSLRTSKILQLLADFPLVRRYMLYEDKITLDGHGPGRLPGIAGEFPSCGIHVVHQITHVHGKV